jgi:hypothetical protein
MLRPRARVEFASGLLREVVDWLPPFDAQLLHAACALQVVPFILSFSCRKIDCQILRSFEDECAKVSMEVQTDTSELKWRTQ